jgi:ATP-dependent Lon protease
MIPLEDHDQFEIPESLPLVPVRDMVVFPYTIVPLFVSRPISISAVEQALSTHRLVLLIAQKQVESDDPEVEDLHRVGTVGMVMRMRRLSDGRMKVLVQGLVRGRVEETQRLQPFVTVRVSPIYNLPLEEISLETEALMRSLREKLQIFSDITQVPGPDVLVVLQGMRDPGRLADLIASNLNLQVDVSQQVLQTPDPVKRLRLVGDLLSRELELVETKTRIEIQTKEKMGKTQREYFLREQLNQIRSELGEGADDGDLAEIAERIEASDMPEVARKEANKQLVRLRNMHTESAEAGTIRTYLDWLTCLTWQSVSEDRLDLKRAQEVLDEDHMGLEEAKDRVLEFLGVRKLNSENPGAILLLVGPPGVGKTSLGRSIARAMDRSFVRVSLGGVRDSAEISGHRRTYVGAMPGRIIQGMKQVECINPVFLLDEIDKLGQDFRGDPAAALLEVLDPEQNTSFVDHYLNLPFDLSKVMFIATANRTDTIPGPLLDRAEEILLPGYSVEEKIAIAEGFLVPRQIDKAGLGDQDIRIGPLALRNIVERHTREAGLRQLERAIAQICRKIARRVAEGQESPGEITPDELGAYLGPPVHLPLEQLSRDAVGVANGLAWTPSGGEIIQVETVAMTGRGQLILTGQLGEVMKESAQAALSFARSREAMLELEPGFFASHDIHIHVPAGSIPKDGPSAGVTMAVALVSLLTGIPVRRDVAMTGEISLSGRMLPVGGVREKLLAARRAGISRTLVPEQNREEVEQFPDHVTDTMEILYINSLEQALQDALISRNGTGTALHEDPEKETVHSRANTRSTRVSSRGA